MQESFWAPSPRSGDLRLWEAMLEVGNDAPVEFASTDANGKVERYSPKDEGYRMLLLEFNKHRNNT